MASQVIADAASPFRAIVSTELKWLHSALASYTVRVERTDSLPQLVDAGIGPSTSLSFQLLNRCARRAAAPITGRISAHVVENIVIWVTAGCEAMLLQQNRVTSASQPHLLL